ncbi:MAG: hypothetical protein R3270_01035 [Gammaproteobacteria bacterium]|nr:hypothetical protein [Gammaproteobacteria bacterium]
MGAISKVIGLFGGPRQHPLERIEQALQSLGARGLAEGHKELSSGRGYVVQWSRGNFGQRVTLDSRLRDVIVTPVALGVAPFGGDEPVEEIQTMDQWLPVGSDVNLGRLRKIAHVDLIEAIRLEGLEHPCVKWFGDRLAALAEGRRLKPTDLQSMVLLGARKFLKSIPNTDRTHERIPAAIITLLDMAARERRRQQAAGGEDMGIFGGEENYAQAILEFLQETHPMETRRAIRQHALR